MRLRKHFISGKRVSHMNKFMNEMMKSKGFKIAAISVGVFLVVLVSFIGGVKVGSHRALFSCNWGENYAKNFMGTRSPMDRPGFPNPMGRDTERNDFRNAHGLSGVIISMADNNLVIKDKDGKENTVAVTDKTVIKDRGNDLKIGDLKAGDKMVVMGRPDGSGTVAADLIRVFDKLPADTQNSNTPAQNNNQ